ncbi:uncharacterized protein MKK02DRAFT_31541 [Dioszegia hungarica]|uniref:Uncharacterized protein n=1 Tax=Dioszegia hungarica TaxID=4972 RepID=A0AA38HAW6_9TREE|nr:uncharacterized protein MKK02DRAFT_31541 [Dioszegia hungarica]KAI9638027.1 hypothetical protein MKK02DRAFT_31541 [Dioszegia hungarica]
MSVPLNVTYADSLRKSGFGEDAIKVVQDCWGQIAENLAATHMTTTRLLTLDSASDDYVKERENFKSLVEDINKGSEFYKEVISEICKETASGIYGQVTEHRAFPALTGTLLSRPELVALVQEFDEPMTVESVAQRLKVPEEEVKRLEQSSCSLLDDRAQFEEMHIRSFIDGTTRASDRARLGEYATGRWSESKELSVDDTKKARELYKVFSQDVDVLEGARAIFQGVLDTILADQGDSGATKVDTASQREWRAIHPILAIRSGCYDALQVIDKARSQTGHSGSTKSSLALAKRDAQMQLVDLDTQLQKKLGGLYECAPWLANATISTQGPATALQHVPEFPTPLRLAEVYQDLRSSQNSDVELLRQTKTDVYNGAIPTAQAIPTIAEVLKKAEGRLELKRLGASTYEWSKDNPDSLETRAGHSFADFDSLQSMWVDVDEKLAHDTIKECVSWLAGVPIDLLNSFAATRVAELSLQGAE